MDLAGISVLVSGAGPVGLVAAQIADALGARRVVVVEPNVHRRRLAEALGAQAVAPGDDAVAAADTTTRVRGGFDLVLECSGALAAMEADCRLFAERAPWWLSGYSRATLRSTLPRP